ncbi:MAG TPA: EthD domain-containing protein, partial [Ktedonobacteraceae bacterium]
KRAGMKMEDFIEYYENKHVPLINSLAPTPIVYKRRYVVHGEQLTKEGGGPDFDVVTELGSEYMAPEQWEGQVVPASDQYALGVMVYQLLTGQLPFQGSVEQVRTEHLTSWPTPPSTINPTLPRELDAVVAHALAKKPGERYATVIAFAEAFAQAIQPMPQPAPAPPPAAPVYVAAPAPPLMPVEEVAVNTFADAPRRRLSRGMIVLIAVVGVLLIMGLWGVVLANSGKTAQSSADATATANTNLTTIANAGANAQTTATANANATVNANATAKAQASGHADATATAKANANATATVAPAAALSGNWVNVDSNTKGITQITITNNGLTVTVNPISRCVPTDCNWGTQTSQYTGSPFKIVFVVNGKSETLAIAPQGPQLTVVNGSHTYLFNKG